MNRRWQKDAAPNYFSLLSYNKFILQLESLENDLKICDTSDLYATYSTLHSKSRSPKLHINKFPGFYYFMAKSDQVSRINDPSPVPSESLEIDGTEEQMNTSCSNSLLNTVTETRMEPVIPINSKHSNLTIPLLQKLFKIQAFPDASHIIIAVVDDDGSVSLMRLFNYIQPPFEGPESLPPIQLGVDSDGE
uniref:tRNA-splicing endonuclease subunit Sen15 domain-containing protein n=1 Tax=Polytomella parva TaxID=51329 RepID=A0A7S0YES0_9CHLO